MITLKLRATGPLLIGALLMLSVDAAAHGGQYTNGASTAVPSGSPRPTGIGIPGTEPSWQNWWQHNSEEFLDARDRKQRQANEGVATTTSGSDLQSKPVNALDRRKVLLPALAPLLLHTSTEIVDAAAIAIGRVGDAPEAELLIPLITHGNPKIREAAIIGLGLLRNAYGAQSLVKLLQNPGTDSDDRALAAIALGLSGSHVARIALEDRLGKSSPIKGASRAKTRQLEGCRALGLGLIGDPDCIDLLTARVAKNSSRDANFEPMLLTALARLDEPATARTALRAVGHRKNDVRRSGWILAGRSVQTHETKLVKSLLKALSRERDRFARNMACIALGRIGHPSAVKVLTRLWAKGGNRNERCFAAIGLGISQDIDAVKKLRNALLKEKDLNLRGATAIALGIAGDNESGETLLKLLKTVGDPDLRSHIVWALGMLEFKEAQEELRRLMAGARKSELVMACGLALGVIGDAKALELLIGVLKSSGSITVKGAMARAIGRLGDGRASKALLALANDANQTDRTRSFAVVALGLLGDKRPRNDLSRISIDSNYALISCDALHRVLDIF